MLLPIELDAATLVIVVVLSSGCGYHMMDIDTIQYSVFVNAVRSDFFEELLVADTDVGCCSDCNQGVASIRRCNQGVAIRA